MGKSAANLQQVADHAGVSIATVSRVARGIGQVSAETRERVTQAIAELGFRPNHLGRALVNRRHAAIGVVLPGLSGPYHSEVIAGFEEEAVKADLSVLILGTHLLRESAELVIDLTARVDGMAVVGGSVPDAVVDAVAARGCPVVQLAGALRPGVATIRTESVEATRGITRHLLVDHGFTRLGFVGTPNGSPDGNDRWRGFCLAHKDARRRFRGKPIEVGHDQPGGLLGAERLFGGEEKPPEAVVCVNDEIAMGVLVGALGRSMKVPDDVAIVGFDDIPAAALTTPGLTTIKQPMRELGARSARRLREAIDTGEPGGDDILPTELVIRSSCGCPPDPAAAKDDPGISARPVPIP